MSEPVGTTLAEWLAEPPPLPNVDDIIPLWVNTDGKRRARNAADRQAKADNAQQRAAVQELINRAKTAESQLADAQRDNQSLQQSVEVQAAFRVQAEAELKAIQGNLPIIVQVATQVAAAAGRAVTGVEYNAEFRHGVVRDIRVNYWLVGLQMPIMHAVSQRLLSHDNGREEARFVLSSEGGISESRQRGLRAFHWRYDDCDYCGRRANH